MAEHEVLIYENGMHCHTFFEVMHDDAIVLILVMEYRQIAGIVAYSGLQGHVVEFVGLSIKGRDVF